MFSLSASVCVEITITLKTLALSRLTLVHMHDSSKYVENITVCEIASVL